MQRAKTGDQGGHPHLVWISLQEAMQRLMSETDPDSDASKGKPVYRHSKGLKNRAEELATLL